MKKVMILLLVFALSANAFSQKFHPDSVNVSLKKAQTFVREGKKSEANAIFSVLMKEYPDNREAVQGWLVTNMKRSPTGALDAIPQLDSLQKLYPQNAGILLFKAFIFTEFEKNEEALVTVEKLVAIQPDSADNWILKGQIMAGMKKYEDACSAFEKAITLNPKRADVWGMKAAALVQTGKHAEALTAANKGVGIAPADPNAIYNRGCIYNLMGDKVNALSDLQKAIQLNPNLKQHAKTDEDFKSLYADEDFIKLTGESSEKMDKNENTTKESGCSVLSKNYKRQEFLSKISGKWKVVEAWVHEANLLGERNFYFAFLANDSLKIDEPERNFHMEGTWSIDLNENGIQWKMPETDQSFIGRYDIMEGYLVLSGKGFVGAEEYICLKLKKQ